MTVEVKSKVMKCSKVYENVVKFSVFPKEEIKDEIDQTTYEEYPDYMLRLYLKNDETATFGIEKTFKYKVLSY